MLKKIEKKNGCKDSTERKKKQDYMYVCIEEQIADTSVEPSSINNENHFKNMPNVPA